MSNEMHFLENTFQHIAEQFLAIRNENAILKHGEWGSKTRKAIFFRGHIEVELPHDHKFVQRLPWNDRPRLRREFELIITERHNVFVNWNQFGGNKLTFTPPVASEFVNTGNHDSCWCQMDYTKLLTNHAEMCDHLNQVLRYSKFKPIAPVKMVTDMQLGSWLGFSPIQFCEVEVEPKDPSDTYFLKLKSVKLKQVTMDFVEETNAPV